jgi:hypothetical protein
MRDIDVKDSVHDFSHLRGRKSLEDSEVESEGDSRFREVQFLPKEWNRETRIDGLNWIRGYIKGSTW